MSFPGGFWDDIDPFGSFSVKNQLDLIDDTNKSFKKKSKTKPQANDDNGFESDADIPMKLNKKKRKESQPTFEPLDNKTLDLRNKQKRQRKQPNRFVDDIEEDNTEALDAIGVPITTGPKRPLVTYIPLSKIHARYNEYENENIESSCEEYSSSDEVENIKKSGVYQPANEAEKLLNIFKAKNMESLITDIRDSPQLESPNNDVQPEANDNDDDELADLQFSPGGLDPVPGISIGTKKTQDIDFECFNSFQESIKPKKKRSKTCFGCVFGNKDDGAIDANPFNTLMDIIRQNVGAVANRFLARLAHCYFQKHIRKPMLLRGKKIQNWKTADILDHIESHTKDPVMYGSNSLEMWRKAKGILQNMIFKVKVTPTGEEIFELDKGNFKALQDAEKMIITLYKLQPKEMLFYSETYRIDPSTLGKFVNLNKEIEFTK
jgi:hypothetical protein